MVTAWDCIFSGGYAEQRPHEQAPRALPSASPQGPAACNVRGNVLLLSKSQDVVTYETCTGVLESRL